MCEKPGKIVRKISTNQSANPGKKLPTLGTSNNQISANFTVSAIKGTVGKKPNEHANKSESSSGQLDLLTQREDLLEEAATVRKRLLEINNDNAESLIRELEELVAFIKAGYHSSISIDSPLPSPPSSVTTASSPLSSLTENSKKPPTPDSAKTDSSPFQSPKSIEEDLETNAGYVADLQDLLKNINKEYPEA